MLIHKKTLTVSSIYSDELFNPLSVDKIISLSSQFRGYYFLIL